jgi:hypothetical protein
VIAAAACILKVPEKRREILLEDPDTLFSWHEARVAEPVPRFEHSRRAHILIFGCFKEDAITHIANGRKSASAGTGIVRPNIWSLEPLGRPIEFRELLDRAPARVRRADTHCAARSPGRAGLGQTRAMVIIDDGPVNDLKCMSFPQPSRITLTTM